MTRCAPLLRLAAALSLAFLAACDGGGGGGTGPSTSGMRLAPFSGDAQRGVPGRPLRSPVAVRVTREDGSPVEGVAVRFTPGPDAGEVEVVAGTTNAQGVASAVWTLGGAAPPLRLTATVDAAGVSPGSVTFTAGLLGDSEVDVLAFRGAGDALPIRLLGYRTGAISTGLRWTLTDTTLRIIPFDAADAPDEMVAFAPGMAPGMATGIRWTDRPDTVTLRVRSPVRVP